jgi:hypothetical protein
MDRYVLEKAQLTQIMTTFNTFTELSLVEARAKIPGSFSDLLCMFSLSYSLCRLTVILPDPSCILLPPKSPFTPGKNQLTTIAAALSIHCEASMPVVNAALQGALVEEWGKVRRVDSEEGDTICSCSLGSVAEDSRDATYVWVEFNLL